MLYATEAIFSVILSRVPCPADTVHLRNALHKKQDVTLEKLRWYFAEYYLSDLEDTEAKLIYDWLTCECVGLLDETLYVVLKEQGIPELLAEDLSLHT